MPNTQKLCVHCHYYQPPRGNPFSGEPLVEPDAAPARNWNERITAECYEPNAKIGNFEEISFNIGETLMGWLAENCPSTYQLILQADDMNVAQHQSGNAIAQPMHHTILPLDRREDKVTQVLWGKTAFAHRFGRQTIGMWLPEMAVDIETLEVLVQQGIEWVLLSEGQVEDKPPGAGPFWICLPGGKRIKVFIRDEKLSNDMAFCLGNFGGAGRWAHEVLIPYKRDAGPLTLVATDGETFGHHWLGEEQFLHWLLTYEAGAAGYEVVTLSRYAQMVEPQDEVLVRENTAWSCSHGLGRWATGCGCTPGDSFWKGAVRRAMDSLRVEIDELYRQEIGRIDGVDPIALRDAYIKVVLGSIPRQRFLLEEEVDVRGEDAERLLKLLEAQFYRQRMYASCTYFFPLLESHTTRYGIANAAYAIKLTHDATSVDLSPNYRQDLSVAVGEEEDTGKPIRGDQIFDELYSVLAEAGKERQKHQVASAKQSK
jgi:alpha-amylase/alpha-mannosidase (GH57 family)